MQLNPRDEPSLEFERRFATLPVATNILSLQRDPRELFQNLTPQLKAIAAFDLVNFALFEPSRQVMKMFMWEGGEWPREPIEHAVEQTAVGRVFQNQDVLSIDNLSTEKQFVPGLRCLHERGIRSYSVFPLTTPLEKFGAIGFGNKRAYAFSSDDLEFLGRVAKMVALCLDRNLSQARLGEEKARLRLLIEVGAAQAQTGDLRQPLASILESMQRWAGRDHVGIYLYDGPSHSLHLHMADAELAEKITPGGSSPLEGTLVGQTFRRRRTLLMDYSSLAVLPLDSVKRGMELGTRSLLLVPLLSAQGPLGVLKVARREDIPFSQRDAELMEHVAATIAPVLDRGETDLDLQENQQGDRVPASVSRTLASDIAVARTGWLKLAIEADSETPRVNGRTFASPEALLGSEQLLSAYFRASNAGLCVLDTHFNYLAINKKMAEMNGMPVGAHLGKSVREILGDIADWIEPQFERALITGEAVMNFGISCILPTRTEPGHWIAHYIPIQDETGVVTAIGVIAVEITAEKKLEESLRVSENLRQEKKRHHVMHEVGRLLAEKSQVQQAFPQISAYLRRVLRQEYAALALHDEKTGQLITQALDFPLRKGPAGGAEIAAAKGPQGKALLERASGILTKDDMQEFHPRAAAHLLAEGLKSLCCVPLLRPSGRLGVVVLGSTRNDAFKTDDLTLLNQVAALLANALENARVARELKQLRTRLEREKRYLEAEPVACGNFEEIIGKSAALQSVMRELAIVAPSEATVLILGETGTGKGLIARAIHRTSVRKNRNFITLNCAAIPTGLLESELFGHEKGAFTGAVSQKIGRLELADNGTLFLDEIGEIPLEVQPKFLRFLQDHEFERLGGNRTIKVDLRLITATNRDLAKSVAAREFRSDLFYRLNVFPIRVPALRERREDIPALVRHFVQKFARGMRREIETIPTETMNALVRWDWPGNVRELENFIERSVILTDGTALRVPLAELPAEQPGAGDNSLESTERKHIIRALREAHGVVSGRRGAAHRLGLKRSTLQSMIQRLEITREDYSGQKPH